MSYSYTDQEPAIDPTAIAALIAGDTTTDTHLDRAQPTVARPIGQQITDRLRDLSSAYQSYEGIVPRGAELETAVPEIDAWMQADEAMRDALHTAHAGAQRIRHAIADDEKAAYVAVREGKKIPPPTAPAVEAAAVEAVRNYGARLALAADAVAAVRDALRAHWRAGWRRELLERITVEQDRAIAEHGRFVGALGNLLAARQALIVADSKYGSADYPEQMMPMPGRDDPGWMVQPPWSGVYVRTVLRNDVGSMNRVPLNPRLDDMRTVEAFIRSSLVHEQWAPATDEPE
ncbi:MAG: hypothetical protein ABI658_14865 [Acidimicrobiales bacterium]